MITSFNYKGQEIKFQITDPEDYLQKFWLRGTFYELGMLMFIEARWKKRAELKHVNFMDIGACIGNHSVFFAKVIGARVVSIEPCIENCNIMCDNFTLNKINNLTTPIRAAAGENPGIMKLKLNKTGNSGMHRIADDGDYDVSVISIDKNISPRYYSANSLDLIKIDVEGFNIPVLRGAQLTIEVYHPDIYIECQTPDELQEVEEFLLPIGYKRWPAHFNATPTHFFYY